MRPVSRVHEQRAARPRRCDFSFCTARYSRILRGSSWCCASSSSTSSAVEAARVLAVFLPDLQAEPVEQHVAQLDRRVDVELAARQRVDLARSGRVICPSMSRLISARKRQVDLDPRPLHVGQHLDQRQLHRARRRRSRPSSVEARAQRRRQAQRRGRPPGPPPARAASSGAGRRRPRGARPSAAGARPGTRCARSSMVTLRRPGLSRYDGHQRVEGQALVAEPRRGEQDAVVLAARGQLAHRGVLEQRPQQRPAPPPRAARRAARAANARAGT